MEQPTRRLGRAAQELLGTSFSHAKREVLIGHVLLNGVVTIDPGAPVGPDDVIEHRPNLPRLARTPRTPPLEVLHRDADVLVINKPAGLLVHPTTEGEQDTVLSRAAAELQRAGRRSRALVVHRLDRGTSGVLVLALSHAAAEHLQRQFRAHTVERRYLALVRGELTGEVFVARGIGRPRPGARRAALAPGQGGRPAQTTVRPIEKLGPVTLVEAELGTGRTHQVRIHLSYLGHAVLGDEVYGDPASDPFSVGRPALHAALLGFVHPGTGERLEFRVGPPRDFALALEHLRRRHRARQPAHPGREAGAAATPPPRPHRPRRPAAGAGPRRPGTRPRQRPARPRRPS